MNKSKINNRNNKWLLTITISLAVLGIISIFFPYNILDNKTLGGFKICIGDYNELGDFITGISGPILSLAAFLLLYLTYRLQKRELIETKNF